MRIINFPIGAAQRVQESWSAELEAALCGDGQGPAADSWRELRADVRSLAPPPDPALERRLREEIDRRTARTRPRAAVARLRDLARPGAIGALAAALATIAVALVLVQPGGHRATLSPHLGTSSPAQRIGPAKGTTDEALSSSGGARAAAVPAASAPQVLESPSAPAAAPGRVQQLSAALSLATTPANVQSTSDGVSRLAVAAGGYVASSHVQVQQGSGEASLTLHLPSTRLSATLASIARLAPVRSESQSLQDITSSYDAARQRLTDASAERAALLRALAKASSAGEIDSLREQLSQARSSIAHDQAALRAVSQRASNAEVEVTVLGSARAEGGGLSVHRGLHDAGRVLGVALAVLLIGAAVLLPLALLIAALAFAGRAWRRYRREHALDAS